MKYLLIAFLCCSFLLNFNSKKLEAQPNEILNNKVLINISLSDSIFSTDESLLILEYEIINQYSRTIRLSAQFINFDIFNDDQASIEHCVVMDGMNRYLNLHLDPRKTLKIKSGDVYRGLRKVDLLSVCFDQDSLVKQKYYYVQLSAYENKKKEIYKSNIVKFQWL